MHCTRPFEAGMEEIVYWRVGRRLPPRMQMATPLSTLLPVRAQRRRCSCCCTRGLTKTGQQLLKITPLCLAASFGHLAAALTLLAAGADVSLRCGACNFSVAHAAAEEGHVEVLRAVIEHGAGVDADSEGQRTALHVTADSDEAAAIDVLVKAGASIDPRDVYGGTPLHRASNSLNHEALGRFLEHGAAANAQTKSLRTPLMITAARAGTRGAAEMVDFLLRAGADETVVDKNGDKAADTMGVLR